MARRAWGRRRYAPKRGMGDITSRLANHLAKRLGDRFRTGVEIDQIPKSPNVVLSTPA